MGTANKENVMNVKKGRKKKWGKNVLQHVIMAKKRKKEQQFYQNKSKVCVCVAQVWFYSQNQHLWETDSETNKFSKTSFCLKKLWSGGRV